MEMGRGGLSISRDSKRRPKGSLKTYNKSQGTERFVKNRQREQIQHRIRADKHAYTVCIIIYESNCFVDVKCLTRAQRHCSSLNKTLNSTLHCAEQI